MPYCITISPGSRPARVGQAADHRGFPEDRVLVRVPVVGAADANAAAQRVVGLGEIEAGQVGDGVAGKVFGFQGWTSKLTLNPCHT